jgi:DNA-directed RNA polymerase subunit omega
MPLIRFLPRPGDMLILRLIWKVWMITVCILFFGNGNRGTTLNSELTKKALEKVVNPNVLVNMISRRVRQLTGTAGSSPARPLIAETAGLGSADIALLEIAEGKISWEFLEKTEEELAAELRKG